MYLDPNSAARFRSDEALCAAEKDGIRHFQFLLLPGANMLDFTAAIEPFRVFNSVTTAPAYSWSVVSETGEAVACSNGISFPVDGRLAAARQTDCLVVCSGSTGYMEASAQTLQWLRRHVRFGGAVAAIGTGAFTLARAGLAANADLTLHWSLFPVFEEKFQGINCRDARTLPGDTLSCSAGGSASLDFALSTIQEDFGFETARRVAEICLHDFGNDYSRAQRHPVSKRVGSRHPAIVSIVNKMEQTIHNPVPLSDLVRDEPISMRQIERLFKQHLETTPLQYYRNLRLERARALLLGTDMSVLETAVATGFTSVANFSKHYCRRFGERPTADRKAVASQSVPS